MASEGLLQAVVFLGAAAIAAPIARRLQIGTVIGYLLAGIAIGPYGLGLFFSLYDVNQVLHVAEFGVVLLLFLIGLELRPNRIWQMRAAILGTGSAQVFIAAVLLMICAVVLGLAWGPAFYVGVALALSSTALAIQLLDDKGELAARHGRMGFSVLLFQDLAMIPLLAFAALFSSSPDAGFSLDPWAILKAVAVIGAVLILGRVVLDRAYRLILATGVREAMTASALLTVAGVALLMEWAGLSAALGAFIAGVLLADSAYRHQIQADIEPFKGLLLGLFFMAIGMSLNLPLLEVETAWFVQFVAGFLAIKIAVLIMIARMSGLDWPAARRFAILLGQGGEFAFVLFAEGNRSGVLSPGQGDILALAVTLSLFITPFLLVLDDIWRRRERREASAPMPLMPERAQGHVIIAGFGRMGQVVARVLRARRIPFTALDIDAEQVELVRRFGSETYVGDASRLDILRAAEAHKAAAFVLAIDDVEASVRTAEMVRHHFPDLPIFARARNRQHVYRLLDLGITHIHRETFPAALDITRDVLKHSGLPSAEIKRTIAMFSEHDRKRLHDDYRVYTDVEKLVARARTSQEELEQLLMSDQGAAPQDQPANDREPSRNKPAA